MIVFNLPIVLWMVAGLLSGLGLACLTYHRSTNEDWVVGAFITAVWFAAVLVVVLLSAALVWCASSAVIYPAMTLWA